MDDLLKLARIQMGVLVTFIANRFWIRPIVIKRELAGFVRVFAFSYSNLREAIVGVCAVTMITVVVNERWVSPNRRINRWLVYVFATTASGLFVILQEYKIHNLGGKNVYDPMDVVFSLIGLALCFGLLAIVRPGRNDHQK